MEGIRAKESLYIRVIRFASSEYPQGFKHSDIISSQELNLEPWEKSIITRHFETACHRYNLSDTTKGETIFLFIIGDYNKPNSDENKYILTFEAEFAYIDYQELKFARENAREARRFSMFAILISILSILVSSFIPIWIAKNITQNVVVDSEIKIENKQLDEIKNIIETSEKKLN